MNYTTKYVLKIKKLNKSKKVIIFRRNYLSIENFEKTNTGWFFQEEFFHYGTKSNFSLSIDTDDLSKIFGLNSKTLKIKGNKNNFGLFVRLEKRELPFVVDKDYDIIKVHLECEGKHLPYDDGSGIKNTKKKKEQEQNKLFEERKPTKSNNIAPYSNVGYAMSHPYQGGGVSPR